MDKKEIIKLMEKARKNRDTKKRNDFNKIEQDLKGDELKKYVQLRDFILQDDSIYEHYRAYNLILLDIVFDENNEEFKSLTLEEKEIYFHYERAKDFHVMYPDLMKDYYKVIKELILSIIQDPETIMYVDKLVSESAKELEDENLKYDTSIM